ncbi:Uncharacterized protein BM_BM18562 [Brugia malayi]|uniref:Uncharacterized protein n=1 Tax=Brugia malayi TaxID=6279 RepID=A0A4E9ET45_BRUMA|nr:Uncharacterized protein BM_BM18562 [Brugia malayi]VIO87213.1 Uncharacterized protein BM_BM18562 [Brugia malayi]
MLEKHLKEELNCKHNETERNAVEILQIQLEKCVKNEICEVGQQQLSRHGVVLRGRKGSQRMERLQLKSGKTNWGRHIQDVVIRLEEGKTRKRQRVLWEHLLRTGQKSLGTKKTAISQHEILVEQKKSVDTTSPEAMKRSQEKSVEEISIAERQNMEEKPIVSENDRHETISERVYIEQPELKDLKEAGLRPPELVLESIVSMKHGQDANTMQYETLNIHPDLIISEITKQGDLKQHGIEIEGTFESSETSEDGFFSLAEKMGIASTSVITIPAALATIEIASAYECVMEKHQQSLADSELEDKMFSVKKLTTTYGTESENPANDLEVEVKKVRLFENIIIPDERVEEYGSVISKTPTTEEKHVLDMKSPAESEIVDQLRKTEDLVETETKSLEDIIPDERNFEEYGSVISKTPTTEEKHVTDMKSPAESEVVDRITKTHDLVETETKSLEDIIPDERNFEEYGSVISKTPITQEKHVLDMKSPAESETVDQLRKTEDLVETETKSLEDIIPDERNFEEYGSVISKTPITQEKHVLDMKSPVESEVVDRITKTHDLVETETKSLEDIIPDERNFEEYGSVISKTPTTEEKHVTDMKSPAESEVVDRITKTHDLVETETKSLEDIIPDERNFEEYGSVISKTPITQEKHVLDMKSPVESEVVDRITKTHDLVETETKSLEDIIPDERNFEEYGSVISKTPTTEEKHVTDMKSPAESEVVDRITKTHDLVETETKSLEDIIPDERNFEEYGSVISITPTTEEKHVLDMKSPAESETVDQLRKTEDLVETETKSLEDIIPDERNFEEYGSVISKTPTTEEKHVTDMKSPAESEVVDRITKTHDLVETETKSLEDIIPDERNFEEYGSVISKTPITQEKHVLDMKSPAESETVDQLRKTEDLVETETKSLEDIIPDERNFEEYGSVISKTPTTEEKHVTDMKSPAESEVVDRITKTHDLVETETKSLEDIIPDERNFEEYGSVISKTPITQEKHVTDMKSPAESETVDQLRKTEDLVETETKSLEDIIPDERNFEEYGSVISKTPTTEEKHVTDMKSPAESEVVDRITKTHDLVETETKSLEDIIPDERNFEEYGSVISKTPTTEEKHVTDMKSPAESEVVDRITKTHDLVETETKSLEDIIPDERNFEEYGSVISKTPITQEKHVLDMKSPVESEVVDRITKTHDLVETETKSLEDIIPDERNFEEYGSVISKTPTTEEKHVTDMKSPAESEVVDRITKTHDLVETETKSLEDIIPDERNFEEYGSVISKTLTTEEKHVTDMKSPAESEIVDQLRKTEDLVETETKSLEDIIPDERNFEEYGSVISKTPTTEEKHVLDMKSPVESEVVDRITKTHDLVETETKSLEDIIPDERNFEEYGSVISKTPTTEEKHVTDMKSPAESETVDQLRKTEDLVETETKSLEDIIPDERNFEEYGSVISKTPTTEEKHVTDMKSPAESETVDQLRKTEDLVETETKSLEDIIPDERNFEEYGSVISKTPTTEEKHVTDMKSPAESETVDQLRKTEDLVETETKSLEDIIPDERNFEEYGSVISKTPTTEEKHVLDMKSPAESEIVDRITKTHELVETETKSLDDIIPDERNFEEYGSVISKTPTTEEKHVLDMKSPAESETVDQLRETEDLVETEGGPFDDNISDREILGERGAMICNKGTTKGHTEMESWRDLQKAVDVLCRMGDLEETEGESFEDIMQGEKILGDYAISGYEFASIKEKPVSSWNAKCEADEPMKQYGNVYVTDSESEHLQSKVVKSARNATEVAVPIVLAKFRMSEVRGVDGGDKDMQMVSETPSSETRRVVLEWMQSMVNDVSEERNPVESNDRVTKGDVCTKEQVTLLAKAPAIECLKQECADHTVVPAVERENRLVEIYKTTVSEHEILQPLENVQHQSFMKKDLEETETKQFESMVSECHFSQSYDISVAEEIIIGECKKPLRNESEYPDTSVEMFRKNLEGTGARKSEDILQQECGASLLKELVKEEKLTVVHGKEQKYAVPQAGEKKHLPFNERESEESACTLQKDIENQQSEMEHSEGFKVKVFKEEISKNMKSEGIKFGRVVSQKFVEEMKGDKRDSVEFAKELVKGQIVGESPDVIGSWNYKETGFSREISSGIAEVKGSARDEEAFLLKIQSEIEDRQRTTEFAATKNKEECIDTGPFQSDMLFSSDVSFADLVFADPLHGTDDTTGIEQLKTESRDLQKMGKLISNLTTEQLPTKEKETVRLSKEEITPQQMQESLIKIQGDVENLVMHQSEQSIICKGLRPVAGTEKIKEKSRSKFYSITAAFEQPRSGSPKKKDFERVFYKPGAFLDYVQEYKDNIKDVEYSKTSSDADAEDRNELCVEEEQRWTDEKKLLKFAEETGTVAKEIILTPDTLTTLDTTKICDHDVKSDIRETPIEQLPDTDHLQLMPLITTRQYVEAAVMQGMVAEEGIIKKEIVYDPAKNLNEPVLKDEEERIGRITGSFAVETLDREPLINMHFQSSADQNAVFISSDMQMDTSFLEKISQKNCGNEVLIESVDENMQIGTFFKENMRKEVPENNEFQPMVPSIKSVEEGVTLKTGMAGSKEKSLAELVTEEGTSYEVDLDGKSHLIMDHKSRMDERTKSSAEDKYPYELTVDISWALEEKDDTDAETEVQKQKSSYMEQVITYPSDDTLNVITEERVTGSIAKKCKDSSIKLNGDSNKSSARFESMKWEKLTDGFEMTSEKLKMKGLMGESAVKAEKVTFDHNKGFVIKIPRTDKEESESFFIHRFEPKEYHMKSSEITAVESTTTQKWLGAEKESQEDLTIQRRQISELSRDEKLENVDAKALAMMNNQKEYEKRLITMEGDQELNEKAEMAQNLEKLKIYSSDGMMPQQPAGNDKKSCLLKRSSEQLITKHELMTSFEKGELERDISNKKITSSWCELSREEPRNIASEAFLDTIEICSIIPQQRKNVQIFAKESDRYQFTDFFLSDEKVQKEDKSLSYSERPNRFSVIEKVTSVGKESFKDFFASAEASRSGATSILEASGVSSVSRSLETVQVVEGQKSFLRSASFDVADNSMEKKKREEKISHYGELEGHINASVISSAEAIVERNNVKVIYDEVTGALWQQADGDTSEKTFSRRQLELAAKEKSTVQLKNEQNITLSSAFDRYSAGQQNCQKFTLSRKKEVEKGASSSFFASVFLNYAEDTQIESLQKVEKRTKSLEETAVVPQKKIEEEIFINKLSHSVGEYLETKKDVYEIKSVRNSNNGRKMKTIAESTSEFVFEESLTLTKAPLARQNIAKGSFETDKETKITHVIDLEVNAGYLVGESKGKLGETVSRSNVSEQSNCSVNSLIGKHCSNKSPPSEERTAAEKSVPQVEHEHEADYECDLKKKLETFAEETRKLKRHVEGCNSLLKEYERNEEELNIQTTVMVDDVKAIESLSRSESTYKTATATSRDGYDTCLTSQEDTFETAPGYHSQESEYTTATSEASSRLSVMSDECRESATPIAILSPVQSDRLFTASQDEEQEPSRQESRVIDPERSSRDVPDIELVSVEDEDDMGEGLLLTTSGILLAPDMDPGRPVSPVPPGFSDEDESIAVAIASDYSRKVVDGLAEIKVLDSIIEAPGDDADQVFSSWKQEVPNFTTFQESVHEKAMDFEKECFPQYSYLSTENKTSIVHRIEEDEIADVALSSEAILYTESDSLDSLDKISVKSGSSGKKYSTSRRSSTSSRKGSHDEPQTFLERLTPELKMSWIEKNQEVGSAKQTALSLSDEYPMYMENGQVNPVEVELETLHEEPEEADSLNERSASLNGQGTDISVTVGKYKTVSSDNVSETSLQEFERIERDVLNKGESSLSGSEAELYVAGKLKTADGSTSSLAEFERLEQEVIVEGSQQDEAMILSDIREESEVEEMSIRDDDEEEQDSISDIKAIPVEEDIQVATPLASPTDSIERDFENFIPEAMGTSIDSLEINAPPQSDLIDERYLTEYEVIEKVHEGMHDSLEIIPQDKDFMQEEVAMREVSKDRQTLLSDDTVSIYQDQEEKDSLAGDLDTVLHDYPTTLTTFETMQINEDGSTEIISRKVLTRVTDPVISHVQFTGTENEHRLRDLEREEQFETVDVEGNITRTTLHRSAPSSSAGTSLSTHRG